MNLVSFMIDGELEVHPNLYVAVAIGSETYDKGQIFHIH
jgi:hypothetical protein